MRKLVRMVLLISIILPNILFAQDMFKERIRKIDGRKKSIYHDGGIFSLNKSTAKAGLKGIRHSYTDRLGYERLVFDFESSFPPKTYGFMSKDENKLYLDFFETSLSGKVDSFGNSKFVNMIDIFPLKSNQVSLEVTLKQSSNVELFYLENPGRLVVDIKI